MIVGLLNQRFQNDTDGMCGMQFLPPSMIGSLLRLINLPLKCICRRHQTGIIKFSRKLITKINCFVRIHFNWLWKMRQLNILYFGVLHPKCRKKWRWKKNTQGSKQYDQWGFNCTWNMQQRKISNDIRVSYAFTHKTKSACVLCDRVSRRIEEEKEREERERW